MTLGVRDVELLERCLELAERGLPNARPNPIVGALMTDATGNVLAEGWHERWGATHAERAALASWDAPVPEGSTLYVSLEPCAHTGRQPPCTEAILEAGIRRVVVASPDSNPLTAGAAERTCAQAHIEFVWGPEDLARRAIRQNAGFHLRNLIGRPRVTYKWAMTRNGRLTTGDPRRRWISCEHSRRAAHDLRAASGAVAIGVGTVLADDPLLTFREGNRFTAVDNQPLRVVFDRALRMPPAAQLVQTCSAEQPVLVICGTDAPGERAAALRSSGVEVWRAPPGRDLLDAGLAELAARQVNDVLLESGPTLASAWHTAGVIDRLVCFVAPLEAAPAQPGFAEDHPLRAALATATHTSSGTDERWDVELAGERWMRPLLQRRARGAENPPAESGR